MTTDPRPYTDQDRELVYEAMHDKLGDASDEAAGAVLDALTADGWGRVEETRRNVAQEIARAIEAECIDPEWPGDDISRNGEAAAAIARDRATSPAPTQEPSDG